MNGKRKKIGELYIQRAENHKLEGHVILSDTLLQEAPIDVLEVVLDWKTALSNLYADLYIEQFGEHHDS